MKKQFLNGKLSLNKKTISNFKANEINGGGYTVVHSFCPGNGETHCCGFPTYSQEGNSVCKCK